MSCLTHRNIRGSKDGDGSQAAFRERKKDGIITGGKGLNAVGRGGQ